MDFDELDSKLNNNEDLKIESYFIDKNNIAFGQKIIDKNLDLQSSCQNFIKNINTIYKNKIDIALNSINANTKVVASFKLDGGVAKNNNIISLDYYKQLNKLIEILNKYCVNLFRLSEKISVCNLENYKSIAELEEKDN